MALPSPAYSKSTEANAILGTALTGARFVTAAEIVTINAALVAGTRSYQPGTHLISDTGELYVLTGLGAAGSFKKVTVS